MNSKKRKLKYIREKNRLRNGGVVYSQFKISKQMLNDNLFIDNEIAYAAKVIINRLNKKYKMEFAPMKHEIGQINDDFIRNLDSIRIPIKKA